nr:hypothetical protein [Paludifilum halophilum]
MGIILVGILLVLRFPLFHLQNGPDPFQTVHSRPCRNLGSVDGPCLSLHQASVDALLNHLSQNLIQHPRFGPTLPGFDQGTAIRHRIVKVQPAKPAIPRVHRHFLMQPVVVEVKQVAQKHGAKSHFGVDGRTPFGNIEGFHHRSQKRQIQHPVDTTKEMILGDQVLQIDVLEQRILWIPLSQHEYLLRPGKWFHHEILQLGQKTLANGLFHNASRSVVI